MFPGCRSNALLRCVLYINRICAQDLDFVPKDLRDEEGRGDVA